MFMFSFAAKQWSVSIICGVTCHGKELFVPEYADTQSVLNKSFCLASENRINDLNIRFVH